MKKSFVVSFLLANSMGLIIAWVDSSPNWDDTGITVGMIFLAALICGFIAKSRPWLIALSVSLWVPIFNIVTAHNYAGLFALVPGFIGAYIGYFIKRTMNPGQ
jgi:uncharacterized membrane protein